jgi:DNA modification methylase
LEVKAYRDTWGRGLDSYVQWFYEAALLLRELLADHGSIYVHVGWQVSHYVKNILDGLFGYENFRNEIIWKRTPHAGSSKARSNRFPTNHEAIFWFSKTENYVYRNQFQPHDEKYIRRFKNPDNDPRGPWQSVSLKTYSQSTFEKLKQENKLISPKKDQAGWRYKWFLSETPGKQIEDIWTDISAVNSMAEERTTYPTQKPVELLERIIKACSNQGDLILDCFCGSGTTPVVAEQLNRCWIACDLGRFAIHTTRKRLLGIPNVKPFVVQNLGKYERQQWMGAEFKGLFDKRLSIEQRYRHFILQLYSAEPVAGYVWLHGAKVGRMVHIGGVDSPVSDGDVKSIVQEFWKAVGKTGDISTNGVDILGWDFAFELNETAKQFAAANKVDLKFKKIPTEVLEKKAVEQGDIKFYELASLDVSIDTNKQTVKIKLSDFMMPLDDVPQEVRGAITHWSQWIDYWSVDWDYKDDTFHNQWQSYRTRKDMSIELKTSWKYREPGKYAVVVKVIDILGNDTTKMVEVDVS